MKQNYFPRSRSFSLFSLTWWVTLLLIGGPGQVVAQNSSKQAVPVRNDIVPPAPTAASLGKFADVPVSLYTGKPQITVPLWDVTSGKLRVPVSLEYNAGGIKVEDIASWVGLGWALNAGGVITRSVRGLPDDDFYGYWNTANYTDFPGAPVAYSTRQFEAFSKYAKGEDDSQPDLFYFNFGGKSGKFVRNREGQVIPIPYQNIKIRPLYSPGSSNTGRVLGWEITAEDGTRYVFKDAEYSNSYGASKSGGSISTEPARQDYTSSWFLSEIISTTNDRIVFEYTNYDLPAYPVPGGNTKYTRESLGQAGGNRLFSRQDVFSYSIATLNHGRRLHKIVFTGGEVEFVAGATRCDLPGDAVLKSIVVRKTGNSPRVIREFTLKQGYLRDNSILKEPLESFQCPVTRDYNGSSLQYRLMLLEVAESNGESKKPPHQFTYFTGTQAGASLPYRVPNWMETVVSAQSKGYYSQDHWGYFNGRENVDTLVPGQQYSGTLEPGQGSPLPDGSSWLSGADRSPVLEFAQLGSLAKITYPTGGNTTFEWALHTFVPPPASDANSISLTASVLRHWSWYTSPPGPENKPLPIIINNSDAKSGGTSVKIAISSYFPCACPSSNGGGAATESCNPSIHVWFIIREKATNKARFTFSVNYLDQPQPPKFEVFLENGEYYLDHHFENGWPGRDGKPQTEPDPARPYGLTLEWPEATEVSGGGLRVAQITDYDPVARQRLVKQYEYKLTNGSTSGTLVSFPQYGYHYQEHISAQGESCTGIPEASAELDNKYFVRSSTSTAPLGVTQGSPVGYSKVTVYHAVQGEALGSRGKTEYTYTSPADYKDETPRTPSFPFAPANSRDWQRGLLTSQTDYRRAGTDYVPVKSLTNEYTFYKETDSANPNVAGRGALGIKVGYDYQWVTTNCGAQPFSFSPVNVTTFPPVAQYFNTSSGYALLTHAATAVYDPQDATRQTRTDNRYRYGLTHLELTEDARLASTGDSLKTTYRYPDDIAVGNGSAQQPAVAALQQLQTAHIANAVVEKREWLNKKGTTDWKLLAGTLTTFRNLAADPAAPNATIVVPAETQAIATAIPLASPTPTEAATGSLTFDAHYQVRDKFDAYTPTGQLLQRTRVPQQATTYLWGYGQQYPVAEIKNATYAEVLAVLGQPVVEQLAGTAPGTDAQVRQALQPLRTRLKNAQVSTFTYAPLVGMTSQTDPSGRTTTYEYDELGRLVRARDEHDRILSQQRYQYARP